MKKYIFIANGTKPKKEAYESKERVKLGNFIAPCVKAALNMGYDEVHVGVNRKYPEELECDLPVKFYDANSFRSITAIKDNKRAYKNLCERLKEGDFDAIHCNTPIGGMVGRFAARKFKLRKVIYTAHGFHFYKGAPLFNRTILKWAEKIMARWTDAIITMNQEDYEAAKKFKLKKGGKVYFVHGVGVDTSLYVKSEEIRQQKRAELNLKEDDIMLISMGDLIPRKNYPSAIKAIAKTGKKNLHYFICGKGAGLEELQNLAKAEGVEEQIHFLGFRTDVKDLLQAADVFLFTTRQEGLPRSMMEAMASGLPCVASKIRGNVDLIEDGIGGYLAKPDDVDGFAKGISALADDKELRARISANNLEKIKEFDVSVVEKEMQDIYEEVLGENK